MMFPTAPSRAHLVVGACLTLCGGLALATGPTAAQLNSIVLYGNTTIAQDSTSSWGVWDQLEPTAAGPDLPKLDIPGLSEWYRSLAQVAVAPVATPATPVTPPDVLATQICAGGSICGFGRATPLTDSQPAQFAYTLVVTPVTLTEVVRERAAAVATEVGTRFVLPAAIRVQSQLLGEVGALLASDSGLLNRNGSTYSSAQGPSSYSLGAFTQGARVEYVDGQPVAGWFSNPITRFVMGMDGPMPMPRFDVHEGVGVIGMTTPDADMSSLRNSNATATYRGYDINGLAAKVDAPNVVLNVNFGTGRFSGSINGGADQGMVQVRNTSRGSQLDGRVGVVIDQGVITGANFMSTALSAKDGSIGAKSVVQGAFMGANAAVAIGVADINKTSNAAGGYTNANHVTTFQAVSNTGDK